MSKKLIGTTGLLLALALLLSINIIAQGTLQTKRIDLTEAKLYTLTGGTKNILKKLDETVTLRFFFSDKATKNIPSVQDYGKRVRELLEEYAANSGGKVKLEVIDPVPFSDAEDRAVASGMQGVPISRSENIYFGLNGSNSTDDQKVIPFFDDSREEFLEYDLSALVSGLSNPKKKKIYALSSLPINGKDVDPVMRMMDKTAAEDQPWAIMQYLRNTYEVNMLEPEAKEIPADTDVLLVVHPKNLPADTSFAIDQYVMNGGKTIIFVDPHAEADIPPPDAGNPVQRMTQAKNSDMPALFTALGVQLVKDKIAGDSSRAQSVNTGTPNRPEIMPYLPYLQLKDDDINREEVFTNGLKAINVGTSGVFEELSGHTTTIKTILQTTANSMQIAVDKIQFFADPKQLMTDFVSANKRQPLAVAITGSAKSSFPDGKPGDTGATTLKQSGTNGVNVFLFGDVDMLTDRMWVQVQRFMNQQIMVPSAGNGDLLLNAVDFLGGSQDLISVRSRSNVNRPFLVVEELQKGASEKFAKKQAELENKLSEAEKKITELESKKTDGSGATALLTPEQKAEIEKFKDERIKTRAELRKVQLSLSQDIEQLGQRLKLINIALIPTLVAAFAVILGILKVQRRRRR